MYMWKEIYLLLNLCRTMYKLVVPEFELWVLDKFNETDEQAPGVGAIHNQPLQQDPAKNKTKGVWVSILNMWKLGLGKWPFSIFTFFVN